jgi:uncharacterized membrane protein YqaE (UPF0057 family)
MDYFLAIVLPPVAVLLKGKPGQALLNFVLTLFFWFPGAIHACIVVADAHAQKRHREMLRAVQGQPAYAYAAYPAPPPVQRPVQRPVPPPQQLTAQTSMNLRAEAWVREYAAAHPVATWSVAAASVLFIAVVFIAVIIGQ